MITYRDLIDNETGEINRPALWFVARRRANAEYGSICPKSIREAMAHYRPIIEALQYEWKHTYGLPVETVTISYTPKAIGALRSQW